MSRADDPHTYHRRIIDGLIGISQNVSTLCGRTVNYQQANGSLTNVDCPECIGAADACVTAAIRDIHELFGPALAKLGRKSDA